MSRGVGVGERTTPAAKRGHASFWHKRGASVAGRPANRVRRGTDGLARAGSFGRLEERDEELACTVTGDRLQVTGGRREDYRAFALSTEKLANLCTSLVEYCGVHRGGDVDYD